MSNKIRYPRTTLELSDVTLAVLREGLNIGFSRHYPELTCYNGRRWTEEMGNLSIYYVRTTFAGLQQHASVRGFDVRIVIVRISNDTVNSGFPFFWCTVWYKTGAVTRLSVPPEPYDDEVHRTYYHLPRWGQGKTDQITDFDPKFHFPDLEMIHRDLPPIPIHFAS